MPESATSGKAGGLREVVKSAQDAAVLVLVYEIVGDDVRSL
jgi:hypothetical protein